MEDNKGFKINFFTLLIILMVLIAIVVMFVVFAKNSGKIRSNTTYGNNTNKVENEIKARSEYNMDKTDFALEFLKMENNKSNMIYSPLSIKYALNMLKDGANGNTKKQIDNFIGNEKVTKYENIGKNLSLANSVFIRDTFSSNVKEDYKNLLLNNYNAELKYDPFENAKEVNNWIEKQTLGQIKNMLKDNTVSNPDCKMLLINALAIDMEWEWADSFSEKDTYGRPFYLENGEEVKATMMNQENESENVLYYVDNYITALSMDLEEYDNVQMECIVIMPDSNLHDYINSFSLDDLDKINKKFEKASDTKDGLDISIPRFSYDYDLSLKDDLIDLGVKDAFDSSLADFSNMTDKSEFYVSDALHKANIDFSEKGIKAAAATVIYMTSGMAFQEESPIEININKPFMYIIRDKKTNEIWFVGTVYKPNLWENDKADYKYR